MIPADEVIFGRLRDRLVRNAERALEVGVIVVIEHPGLLGRPTGPDPGATGWNSRMLLPLPIEEVGAVEIGHAGGLHRFERDAARFTPQACRDNALRFDRAAFRRRFAEVLREAQAA